MSPAVASLFLIILVAWLTMFCWSLRLWRLTMNNRQRLAAATWHIGLCAGCALPVWVLTLVLWPQSTIWLPALGLLMIEGLVLGVVSVILLLISTRNGSLGFKTRMPDRKSGKSINTKGRAEQLGTLPRGSLLVWDAQKGVWSAIEIFEQNKSEGGSTLTG